MIRAPAREARAWADIFRVDQETDLIESRLVSREATPRRGCWRRPESPAQAGLQIGQRQDGHEKAQRSRAFSTRSVMSTLGLA
jgi:hypothetical protein